MIHQQNDQNERNNLYQRIAWYALFGIGLLCVAMLGAVGCGGAASLDRDSTTPDGELAATSLDDAGLSDGIQQSFDQDVDITTKPPDGNNGGPLSPQRKPRVCPHQLTQTPQSSFASTPCAEGQGTSCQRGCQPTGLVEKPEELDASFFARCADIEVLCVGKGQEVETLQEAAALVEAKPQITHIRVAAGRYVESVTFRNIQQNLTVEGQSNHPTTGTVIVAPLVEQKSEPHAALRFVSVGVLNLKRLVLSGYGHGLVVRDFVAVNINQSHLTTNLLTGAYLVGLGRVNMEDNIITYNGGILTTLFSDTVAVNINQSHHVAGNGTIAVNINQSHRGVGNDTVAVNINQSHRIPGLLVYDGRISVNINQSHRIAAGSRSQVEALQFGLVVEGASEVTLNRNQFTHNAVGGVRLSPGKDEVAVNINQSHRVTGQDTVSVNINQSHRVVGNDTVAVNINQSHRVVLRNNVFANNGPQGWFARTGEAPTGCGSGCGSSHFCEANLCLPRLTETGDKIGKKDNLYMLGIGAVIAGAGNVSLQGNSFFRNDTSGLLLHSTNKALLEENAWEQNGQRPGSSGPQQFLESDVRMWEIGESLTLKHNVILDSSWHGVFLSHRKGSALTQSLPVIVDGNYISGVGQPLPYSNKGANGFFVSHQNTGRFAVLAVQNNYFSTNRRAGIATVGSVAGLINKNVFLSHPYRAIAIHDTQAESSPQNTLALEGNLISGGTGYGLQIYGGGAKIAVKNNLIEGIIGFGGSDESDIEGDGLNLAGLSVEVDVLSNTMRENFRAGIFLHSIKARLENNQVSGCKYGLMMQSGSSYQGTNEMQRNTQDKQTMDQGKDLSNRKDF